MTMKHFILILIAASTLLSCSKGTYSRLQEIESYIEEDPKRALEEIRNINPDKFLHTPRTKAKHALLHSMALDKNYIDLTTDSIIAPAVKYYSKHGSADDRLLMHYYMGRIYENAGDLDKAAIEYAKGEELVGGVSNDIIVGRLYGCMADVYNKTQNSMKELGYALKAIDIFEKVENRRHYNITKGVVAMAYANAREYDKADSLYKESIALLEEDSVSMVVYLGNYARLKVLSPIPDPIGAIRLLGRISNEYKQTLTADLYCVYAYALQLADRIDECDSIIEQLAKLGVSDLNYWQYLIYKHRGDNKLALEYLECSSRRYERQVHSLLSNTTDNALKDYYSSEAERAKMEMKIKVMSLVSAILAVAMILSIVILKLMLINRKKQRAMETYLDMYENASKKLSDYDAQIDEHNSKLNILRASFSQVYKKQFTTIGDLCLTYLTKQGKKDVKDHIYRKVEKLIANISSDEKLHSQLENKINAELDNIILHLRNDLPKLSNDDMRFICYCIIGFDATLISVILNLSMENVYTKKSRLKAKINALNSPYKENYLMYIQ